MLLQQIDSDLTSALKAKDQIASSSLRNLKAEIKNTQIDKQRPLTDEEVLAVVRKKVKQHKDSIESFKSGGRSDLVETEEQQMAVLETYLPRQLPEDEVRTLVTNVILDLHATPSDFGKVMKEVLTRAKGATDGSVVSKIVKELLK